jgi:hypothetical protein
MGLVKPTIGETNMNQETYTIGGKTYQLIKGCEYRGGFKETRYNLIDRAGLLQASFDSKKEAVKQINHWKMEV